MSLLNFCKNLTIKILKRKDPRFFCPFEIQNKFLNKIIEPQDDIERSYSQYKCQMKLLNFGIVILYNFSSLFLLFFYLIRFFFIRERRDQFEQADAVFISNDLPHNILPNEINIDFPNIIYSKILDGFLFTKYDLKFFFNLVKRHPFSWYFLFKCLIKIATYRFQINSYNPKAILTYSEYSFTSSILTNYCESLHLSHINVMHGEKIYYIRDSFFRFTKFYVWDIFYINLFKKLRADKNIFYISVPPSLKFNINYGEAKVKFDFKYFLAAENKKQLIVINNILSQLQQKGFIIAVRPHPRYSNYNELKMIFRNIKIENLNEVNIEESICTTKNAVALFSTVLNQCYWNNVNVVIDDISNILFYKKLKELNYFMLNKPHRLLSEYL